MVFFRKRLAPEILGEINEMIVMSQKAELFYGSSVPLTIQFTS